MRRRHNTHPLPAGVRDSRALFDGDDASAEVDDDAIDPDALDEAGEFLGCDLTTGADVERAVRAGSIRAMDRGLL